jgi:RimJ/RimL family protein N-acetyltransferase
MTKLKPYEPTAENIAQFVDRLMNTPLYTSDELRNREHLTAEVARVCKADNSLVFDMCDGGGLMGFTDIMPEWKCSVFFKIWDPSKWSVGLVKEVKALFEAFAKSTKVFRFETQTADPVVVKMAKIIGFAIEGVLVDAFRWDGRFYNTSLLVKFAK